MSTTKLFRAGLIATVGVAGLTLTANAQSRYGSVYDYESGRNCGKACVPAPVATPPSVSRYGAPVVPAPTYNPAPIYVDCVQAGTCAPQPSVVYTPPAPAPAPTYSHSVQMAPVNCPSGTTAQADGTCMQTGTSYSSTTTYSEPTTTYTAPAMTMEPVSCPSGTTAQADGTCMQTESSYSSSTTYSSGTTYSSATTYSEPTMSMEPVNCPAGTTAQPDGTCMQSGTSSYTGTTVELYTGDASSSATTYGYSSDGSYGSSDYLPIRK